MNLLQKLTPQERHIIRKWFTARFKNKPNQNRAYYQKWIWRFQKGTARSRMDTESLYLWNQIAGQINFIVGNDPK